MAGLIEQCDREAAAGIVRWQRKATEAWYQDQESMVQFFVADFSRAIIQGIWDNHPIVQAFARHRLDALAASKAGEVRLVEALEPFTALADFYADCEQHPSGCPDNALVGEVVDLTVGDFRRARAALAKDHP